MRTVPIRAISFGLLSLSGDLLLDRRRCTFPKEVIVERIIKVLRGTARRTKPLRRFEIAQDCTATFNNSLSPLVGGNQSRHYPLRLNSTLHTSSMQPYCTFQLPHVGLLDSPEPCFLVEVAYSFLLLVNNNEPLACGNLLLPHCFTWFSHMLVFSQVFKRL